MAQGMPSSLAPVAFSDWEKGRAEVLSDARPIITLLLCSVRAEETTLHNVVICEGKAPYGGGQITHIM